MKKFYEKNELAFAILCIVAYVVIFGNLRTLGDDSPYCAIAMAVMALALFLFVKSNGLMGKYGMDRWISDSRRMLYLIPMWILATGNLWGGISPRYRGTGLVSALVMFALVGFVEEMLFRGFLFKAMLKDGKVLQAIIISSLTFGMGHIVNIIVGKGTLETFVQMFFAVMIGFLFTMVYYKGKSLWPVIIAHSLIDMLSVFAVDNPLADKIYIVTTCIVSAAYGIYLYRAEH
ncbi:MAG: CPBP family intramembrane metalloprotease [Lachnospiraceae bacterium]|nr:CPBP family intramembrane metalloprotease [Erysipelotrichaceae bacterium]MBR2544669.1 CPBP family intramembrane metalloprotease [Erysipelotrichaceae bacterium]MBR4341953.1 CPBP family intramembrane metalloprotease [Lachnospiraceae bacterium]